MIDRRAFGMASLTLLSGASLAFAAPSTGTLRAYAMRTGTPPGLPLDKWPLDHTAVVGVGTGVQWGCFGRTAAEEPKLARLLAEAPGDELWAAAIGGSDGHAGIEIDITGACQQCSNRLLIPAGLDVDASFGSEIATPIFGKYGLGLGKLVERVKDAALEVNKTYPGRVSDGQVDAALRAISYNVGHEWDVVRDYMERVFKPRLGPNWAAAKVDLEHTYFALFNFREAVYSQYEKGHMTKEAFVGKMRVAAASAIELVIDIIGPGAMAAMSPAPPDVQAAYVFRGAKP